MNGPNATGLHQPYTDGGSRYEPGNFLKRAYGNWGFETGAAGPGNAPFRQNSSLDNAGNTIPDWSDFLGPPMRPLDNNPAYHVENYDLPDAYRGSSFYKSKVMISLITSDDFCNELLPWEVREDCMEVAWDVWEFDDHLMNRQPEESVNRLVTSSKASFSAPLIRHGLNLLMEDGFRSTEQGQLAFFKGEQQLKNAFVETMALSAAIAILNVKAPNDTYHQRQGGDFQVTTDEYEQLVREHVERFGICHKKPDGFASMYNWCKTVLRERGHFNSNYTIVPYGMGKMLAFAQSRYQGSATGPAYGADALSGGQYGTIRESRSFRAGDDRANYDPFFRDVTVGGYFLSNDEHSSLVKPVDYTTAMRSLVIYSEKTDNFVKIGLRTLFENSGLFDDDIKTRAFTDIGRKYFGYYENWHELFRDAGMLDALVKKLQADSTGQSFIDMLHILGQAPPEKQKDNDPDPDPAGYLDGDVKKLLNDAMEKFNPIDQVNRLGQLVKEKNRLFLKDEDPFTALTLLLTVIYATRDVNKHPGARDIGHIIGSAERLLDPTQSLHLEELKQNSPNPGDNVVYLPTKNAIKAYEIKYNAGNALDEQKDIYAMLKGAAPGFVTEFAKLPTFAEKKQSAIYLTSNNAIMVTVNVGDLKGDNAVAPQETLDFSTFDPDTIGLPHKLLLAIVQDPTSIGTVTSPTPKKIGDFASKFDRVFSDIADFDNYNFDPKTNTAGRVRISHRGRHIEVSPHLADQIRFNADAFFTYHHKKWSPMLENMSLPDDMLSSYDAVITDAVAAFGAFQGKVNHKDFARKAAAFIAYLYYLHRKKKDSLKLPEHKQPKLPSSGYTAAEVLEFIEHAISRRAHNKETQDLFDAAGNLAIDKKQGPAPFRVFRDLVSANASTINKKVSDLITTHEKSRRDNVDVVAGYAKNYAKQARPKNTAPDTSAFMEENGGYKVRESFVVDALTKAPIMDGRLFDWLLDKNMPFPLGFIGFRPHQRYTMGSAVHCVAGHDLGSTVVGHVNILHGRDAVRKMTLVNMTGYGKPIVFYPSKAVIFENCMSAAYLGGNGHSFFPYDSESRERYQRGELQYDIFVVAVPVHYRPGGTMLDITGSYDSNMVKDQHPSALQYPSAHIYSEFWRWSHGPNSSEPDQNEYFASNTRHARYNTVCLQSFTANFTYNGAGGGFYSAITGEEGHWGPDVYPGCGKVRKGLYAFFDGKTDFETMRSFHL